MSLTSLREELAGLEFLVGREIERDVIEGDGHTGRGAVVQILPADMNNSFVQRGGWWVVGQFVLLLPSQFWVSPVARHRS